MTIAHRRGCCARIAYALACLGILSCRPHQPRAPQMSEVNPAHLALTDAHDVEAFGRVKWTYAPGDINAYGISEPAFDRERAYVVTTSGPERSATHALRAVDLQTGAERWRRAVGCAHRPTVADDIVFAGNQAFRADSGKLLWEAALPTGGRHWLSETSPAAVIDSPAIYRGAVFLVTQQWNTGPMGPANSSWMHAVDATTGEPLWRYREGATATPAIADGEIYVQAAWKGDVRKLDVASGRELWAVPTVVQPIDAPMAVSVGGDAAYLAGPTVVAAVSRASGQILWQHLRHEGPRGFSRPAATSDARIVFRDGNAIVALDPRTGTEIWRVDALGRNEPIMTASSVYAVGANDFELVVLRADSGVARWRHRFDDAILARPAIDKGILYVASGRLLYAIDSLSP